MASTPPEPLDDAEAIAILEAIARDESERASTRTRALEQLRQWRGRAAPEPEPELDEVVDPMLDLEEPEARRRKRSTGVRSRQPRRGVDAAT